MDSDPEPRLRSLISQLLSRDTTDSDDTSTMIQIFSLVKSMDLDWLPNSESKLMSLVTQAISIYNSIDLDSVSDSLLKVIYFFSRKMSLVNSLDNPDPDSESMSLYEVLESLEEPEHISLIKQILSLCTIPEPEPKPEPELNLISLISQLLSRDNTHSDDISLMIQIVSLVSSMDLDSQPKPESELMSLVSQAISVYDSMDLDSQPEPLSELMYFFSHNTSLVNSIYSESKFMSLIAETRSLKPQPELIYLIDKILYLILSREPKPEPEPEPESKLISLIDTLMCYNINALAKPSTIILLCIQILSLVMSMDLTSKPESESKLMSLVSQAIFVFNSMDLDSQPEPLSELISLVTRNLSLVDSPDWLARDFNELVERTLDLEPEPELISLIHQIFSLVVSLSSRWKELISLSPQVKVRFKDGKVYEELPLRSNNKWDCLPGKWEKCSPIDSNTSHFLCKGCNGQKHEDYNKAPVEVKHPLHPKHYLHLVLLDWRGDSKGCYCCDKYLDGVFYYCSACDFAISIACMEKPPVLSIDNPKWHEHKLALFSRTTSLTCDVCALADSTCPLYICPPCGFVTHQRCLSLPRVIKISRHLHRISFTYSFDGGDRSCGVCRRKIDSDYGGYTCIKNGCSYAAHSKCATQSNVWDGIELEGVPEQIEEEVEPPFVRIRDRVIQHFSHPHHHLILDENTGRDYDENQLCQACVTPIHYGNFYYCLQCDDFILHEKCANLSRKIYNPIHPHLLTLVTNESDVINEKTECSACPWWCTGLFYKCGKRKCDFRVHVECATISEPLDHESHKHPLFLTSKPEELRRCGVCKGSRQCHTYETFNCIECDFSLCFGCATFPQKVRYTHDNHVLTLSYGEETSTMTYWCEACEIEINPKERFYKCDEYCCVTLHIECLVENSLYMKPDVWWTYAGDRIMTVKANNHRMSLPFCEGCGNGKRCQHKFSFIYFSSEYCSISCCLLSRS